MNRALMSMLSMSPPDTTRNGRFLPTSGKHVIRVKMGHVVAVTEKKLSKCQPLKER